MLLGTRLRVLLVRTGFDSRIVLSLQTGCSEGGIGEGNAIAGSQGAHHRQLLLRGLGVPLFPQQLGELRAHDEGGRDF
jgi:hypothetical protein